MDQNSGKSRKEPGRPSKELEGNTVFLSGKVSSEVKEKITALRLTNESESEFVRKACIDRCRKPELNSHFLKLIQRLLDDDKATDLKIINAITLYREAHSEEFTPPRRYGKRHK